MAATNIGSEGFKWFMGYVVDIEDPNKMGRVKVKVFNEHDSDIENDDLHWAILMVPPTSASVGGVGISPTGIEKDSYCFGFYMDATHKQHPVIMGTWHKMPGMDPNRSDVSKLATGTQTLDKDKLGPEPDTAYGAVYPNNKVHQTKSGHVIEIDDTPGKERIHLYHKSGSYAEINNDGQIVIKGVDDVFEIVAKDKHVYVKGDVNLMVQGDLNAVVKGSVQMSASGNTSIDSKGTLTLRGQAGVSIRSGSDIAMAGPGGVSVTEGSLAVLGSISSGTGVSGCFTSPSGKTIHISKGSVSNIF